ncbi:reverse transcriptase N-terminal domain-containing protein [Marinobacter metalliresistant]|uniref:Reverse transcriptase N-terminal domain-containing protein n=1 Tax=Marinobacter metalliresistant TaxID=2961995 RepID=A0ABZ2VYP9_9GAMM
MKERQMIAATASAPSTDAQRWQSIDWPAMEKRVYRLQVRIAKSIREQRWGKARALQHLLSRSFAAKLIAVRRVISTKEAARQVLTESGGPLPGNTGGRRNN